MSAVDISQVGLLNILLVFLLGALYSFIELLDFFSTARSFFKSWWGIAYIFINGGLSVIALILTFKGEVNAHFLGAKILIAGTSALALIRVIVIPIKHQTTGNNTMPMIDIVLNHVRKSYDRETSKFDLSDVKAIMAGIDYQKAAESVPVLCSNLHKTLSEMDGENMNEEIQKFLTLEGGAKEIKAITLGVILVKYIGVNALASTVNELREYISLSSDQEGQDNDTDDDLDTLIENFA